MQKLYKYLFYRAYDLIKLTGNYDLAWGASDFLALMIGVLVLNILYFFENYLDIISMGSIAVATFLILHGVNYFIFLKENKYKDIIDYFSKESEQKKRIGRLVSIAMVVLLVYSMF